MPTLPDTPLEKPASIMRLKSYYDILDVTESASDSEIKSAYRKVIRNYHPDLNPDKQKAEKRTRELNTAIEVLTNSDKRQRYNRQLQKLRKRQAQNTPRPTPKNERRASERDIQEGSSLIDSPTHTIAQPFTANNANNLPTVEDFEEAVADYKPFAIELLDDLLSWISAHPISANLLILLNVGILAFAGVYVWQITTPQEGFQPQAATTQPEENQTQRNSPQTPPLAQHLVGKTWEIRWQTGPMATELEFIDNNTFSYRSSNGERLTGDWAIIDKSTLAATYPIRHYLCTDTYRLLNGEITVDHVAKQENGDIYNTNTGVLVEVRGLSSESGTN